MAEPLPFEDIFRPLVVDASNELRRQVDSSAWELLSPEAHADWTQYLLSRLTSVGTQAAYWQFQIYKSTRAIFISEPVQGHLSPDIAYRQFVGSQPRDRLRKLFDEFPGLDSLCAILVENWVSAVGEFLARLQIDRGEFGMRFLGKNITFPVSRLQTGLSDPHRSGRCVVRLNYGDGVNLIYKPRPLAPEAHFAVLLKRINAHGIRYALTPARCWDRGEYGWMENIDWHPCKTLAEVNAFYWRAGVLLGLVHLARGVDLHEENLIAAGACPVLVDLETLWHLQDHAGTEVYSKNFVVRRTGFLPQIDSDAGLTYAWSALRGSVDREGVSTRWIHINQDEMFWTSENRQLPDRGNLPVCGGKICTAASHVNELQAGFRWTGEQLLVGCPLHTEFTQWLRILRKCRRRLIRLSTVHYRAAARRLTSPEFLRSESPPPTWHVETLPPFAPALVTEIQALERGDIPYLEQELASLENVSTLLPSKAQFLTGLSDIADAFHSGVAAPQIA